MNQRKPQIVAVDFDGTCVTHEYPRVGREIGAEPVLKQMVARGDKIILFTMRSGLALRDAIDWFRFRDIPLYGVNENPDQHSWTTSPKPYAHVYIDDAALGAPLLRSDTARPYVDWAAVAQLMEVKIAAVQHQ